MPSLETSSKKSDYSIQPTGGQFTIILCDLRISRMQYHFISCHGRLVFSRARQPLFRGN